MDRRSTKKPPRGNTQRSNRDAPRHSDAPRRQRDDRSAAPERSAPRRADTSPGKRQERDVRVQRNAPPRERDHKLERANERDRVREREPARPRERTYNNERNADLRKPSRSASARKEIKFYGVNACRALWRARPQDVIRIYVTQELVHPMGDMLKWAASERKAYHIVEAADLERLTESVHHQGICVLAYEHSRLSFADLRHGLRDTKQAPWLIYLDGVENPHNFGAIIRSAAHFGAGFVLGDAQRLPTMSPSACRIAEGGAEHVPIVALDDPQHQLRELKQLGYTLVAADVRDGLPLYRHPFAQKTVLIVGAEEVGVSSRMRRLADVVVTIPGSADVESLNVSVAFGVLASELYRQTRGNG